MLLILLEVRIMPSLPSQKPKFLLDENVKRRLASFLSSEGFDVKLAPKGVFNGKLAELSKLEKRILITNDSDFSDSISFPKERVFSVVLLKIPQDKPESFIKSFSKLLKSKSKAEDFEAYLVVLKEEDFALSPIPNSGTLTK